jgi:inositol-hexakisphosphate kinase
MSKSPNEPENAAPKASVRTEQGHKPPRESDQNKTGWTPPARSKSTSLLTQALSTNYEADEIAANTNPLNDFYTAFPDSQQTYFASQDAQQHNGMSAGEGAQTTANKMATVSSSSAGNLRTTVSLGTTPTSSSTAINFHDMNSVNSLLSGHRELLNKARGRGTSLERTEKEKRIQELPKGPYSTNPGDTALGAPSPQGSTTPEPISTTAPTEGVRARYRSWRDARPGMAAEKAWSIGEQGSDDSGQVEKSITEALTGVEPNSRSRKASHSLRFFKEGLPEDKSKRKDSKTKGPLKDGLSCGKSLSSLGNGNSKQRQESHTRDHFNAQTLNHPTDGQNRGQPPVGRGRPSSKDEHQIVNPTEGLAAEKGYFDLSPKVETVSDQQAKAMPAQLLAEIRKNHNLTPGAAKGSSFSRSIPVTASERSKDDGRPEDLTGSLPTRDDDNSDGEELSQVKSAEEEDDSGEEQISSALFVPHQTPHESPEREIALPGSSSRPKLKDVRQSEVSNSQQWLEEHEVPSRDVDKKYISQEVKSRPLPSPVKLPSPLIEQETLFPDVPGSPDVDRESHDEGGYSTKSEDAGSTDDQDSDTTPTGSLKRRNKVLDDYPQHLHDHQQKAQQPVEAIELIPYRHQVGGHTTMWRFSKRAVCKQLNNRENEFYEKVERYHPNLVKFLPRYAYFIYSFLPHVPEAESLQRPHMPRPFHQSVTCANEVISILI